MVEQPAKLMLCEDLVFRAVFAHQSAQPALRSLLNAIFSQMKLPLFKELEVTTDFSIPYGPLKKMALVDVEASDDRGRNIGLEIHGFSLEDIHLRAMYHVCRGFSSIPGNARIDVEIHPYCVVMLTTDPIPHLPSSWCDYYLPMSSFDSNARNDSMTIIYIRLPREGETVPPETFSPELETWIHFLTANLKDKEILNEFVSKGDEFVRIIDVLEDF